MFVTKFLNQTHLLMDVAGEGNSSTVIDDSLLIDPSKVKTNTEPPVEPPTSEPPVNEPPANEPPKEPTLDESLPKEEQAALQTKQPTKRGRK